MELFSTGIDDSTGAKRLTVRGPWNAEYVEFFASQGFTCLWLNQSLGFTGRRLDFLASIPNLHHLNVLGGVFDDDSGIEACGELRTLELTSNARNKLRLSHLSDLRSVFISRMPGRDDILESASIRQLYIYGYKEADLSSFKQMAALDDLEVGPARRLVDLTGPVQLRRLAVSYAPQLIDISAVSEMEELRTLEFAACRRIDSIEPLRRLGKLNKLGIVDCGRVASLEPIAGRPLQTLYLVGDTKIIDGRIRPFIEQRAMRDAAFHAWRHYDITQGEARAILKARSS